MTPIEPDGGRPPAPRSGSAHAEVLRIPATAPRALAPFVDVPRTDRPRLDALLVSALWTLLTALRMGSVPETWWRYRDDAVITLSHARGLVELGVVSVSASPERVEGYSSPLQFLLAVVYYAAGGRSWELFLDLQVLAGLVGMGYFAARLIGLVTQLGRRMVILGSCLAAVLVMWPFMTAGWLVSGMENSLTGLLIVSSIYAVIGVHKGVLRPSSAGISLALLGIARVELFAFVLPMLALAVFATRSTYGRRAVTAVVAPAVATWVLVHGARWAYFGGLIPNSGLVQRKGSLGLVVAWTVVAAVTSAAFFLGRSAGRRWLRGSSREWKRVGPMTGGVAAALVTLLIVRAIRPVQLEGSIDVVIQASLGRRAGLWLPLSICIVCWVARSTIGHVATLTFICAAAIPITQTTLLGPARLDVFRIFGIAQVPISLLAVCLLMNLLARDRSAADLLHRRTALTLTVLAAPVVAMWALMALPPTSSASEPGVLCCDITETASRIEDQASSQARRASVPLMIVASPDLGKLSHEKTTLTVDLGLLGSPFLARVARDAPELTEEVIMDVLSPDLIELHGRWSCTYQDLLGSPRFEDLYSLAVRDEADDASSECPHRGEYRMYERAPSTSYLLELELTRELLSAADPVSSVRSRLASCSSDGSDHLRCEWVRRGAQRAFPLLAEAERSAIVGSFSDAPAARLDQALLRSSHLRGWHDEAFEALMELHR